jgi:hypothetical protein
VKYVDASAVLRIVFSEAGPAAGEALEFWTHDARQATAALSRRLTVRGA